MRTECLLVTSHHVHEDLIGEQGDTHKARNPFQSALSDRHIVIRPKSSPDDDDAEQHGGDQLDLVTEESDVEDEAGEDGAVVGLSEDGDEDEGGHDAAGQVAARDHEEEEVGDVAPLFTSFSPVEEYHDGCQTT